METGESGVNGAPAVRRANRGNVPGNGNVIHQLHNMAERNVKELQAKIESATKRFHAQVICTKEGICGLSISIGNDLNQDFMAGANVLEKTDLVNKYNLFSTVNGNWGEWSEWSACSKMCKQGKYSRKRKCDSPAPQYGGMKCEGDANQDKVCNENIPCPGEKGILGDLLIQGSHFITENSV